MTWSVSEAKAKLSALLQRAKKEPQTIESRGAEVAVVLSAEEFRRLKALEAAPRETPMQAFLARVEQIKAGRDLTLELAPRRLADDRPPLVLGAD